MHRICLPIAPLLMSLLFPTAHAQVPEEIPAEPEEPEYLIELIVFRYRDGAQGTEEQWSASRPAEDEILLALQEDEEELREEELAEEEDSLPEEELTPEEIPDLPTQADLKPVPRREFQLLDIASRLASSRTYEPLAHVGWKQQGYPLEIAPAYELQMKLGQADLTGTVTFSKGRYLRLDVDVEYRPYGATFPQAEQQRYDPTGPIAPYSPVFFISENRRGMRSNEIHFFDHPQFALLARVTPLESAEPEQAETITEQTQ